MAMFNSKKSNYTIYNPGEEPTTFNPGDFFLLQTNTFFGKLILFGQWLRYHGENRQYYRWTHCGTFIDKNGNMIEALPSGVKINNISKYKDLTYYVVNTNLGTANRVQSVDAVKTFLKDKYGWITDLSIGFHFLTGIRLQLTVNNTINCSGLVAMGNWAGGIFFNGTPQQFSPADIGAAWNVPAPVKIKVKKARKINK